MGHMQEWKINTVNPWINIEYSNTLHTESEVTPFSVTICMNITKILFRQLNCSVKLAEISTRCSSHPQGKMKRGTKNWCTGVGTALARAPMQPGAEGGAPA